MRDRDPAIERLRRSLLRLQDAGARFAASHKEPALGLAFDVEGVGRCALPLGPEDIAALRELAEPSPFGHRDQTLQDPSVRRSWEIPGSAVSLDWGARFARGLDEVLEALAVDPAGAPEATLEKLLIYAEGDFFAPHRDSEKDPSMWGTLVVVLPTRHRGGDLVIEHAGRSFRWAPAGDASSGYLSFLGFFADCLHTVQPVEDGHRVALTWSLRSAATELPDAADGAADLRRSLEEVLADDARPWVACLLDHQYSIGSSSWRRLKGADRQRAKAVRAGAAELDCACFLALADVHEWYSYDVEDQGWTEGSRSVATRRDFGAFQGAALTLDHWIDEQGRACAGCDEEVEDDCIVATVDSTQRTPYDLVAEPWTGNEGGTAEQWYHQAALVIVPRSGALFTEIAAPLEPEPPPKEEAVPRRSVRRRKR